MKGNNQNNYDKRPIRIKDKYNPYTLSTKGVHTDDPHYYVSFVDVNNNHIKVEISKELFDLFDKFELEDLSYIHQVSRNIEHSELLESTLNRRATESGNSLEDTIIEKEMNVRLYSAILSLNPIKRKRVYLYYFKGLTLKEIARIEGKSYSTIAESMKKILKEIKIFL